MINNMEEILTKHITILYNKLTEGDHLYKKWCRKIDLTLKSIHFKIKNQDSIISELNNKIKNLDEELNNKINILELKLHKSNKLIIFLVKKLKKPIQKSYYDIFIDNYNKCTYYNKISLILILFFIIIYYIQMAANPVLIPEYVFMWSFLFAFLGSIFYGITAIINIDPSSVIVNKNVSFIINAIIGISGIISIFVWFNMDVPAIDKAVLNPKVVKPNING